MTYFYLQGDLPVFAQFKTFDIEYGDNCMYDRVNVRGSDTPYAYCGSNNDTILSGNKQIDVSIVTDGSVPATGFRLQYWSSESMKYL